MGGHTEKKGWEMINPIRLKLAYAAAKYRGLLGRYRARCKARLTAPKGLYQWHEMPNKPTLAHLAEMVYTARKMTRMISGEHYPPTIREQAVKEYLERARANIAGEE